MFFWTTSMDTSTWLCTKLTGYVQTLGYFGGISSISSMGDPRDIDPERNQLGCRAEVQSYLNFKFNILLAKFLHLVVVLYFTVCLFASLMRSWYNSMVFLLHCFAIILNSLCISKAQWRFASILHECLMEFFCILFGILMHFSCVSFAFNMDFRLHFLGMFCTCFMHSLCRFDACLMLFLHFLCASYALLYKVQKRGCILILSTLSFEMLLCTFINCTRSAKTCIRST